MLATSRHYLFAHEAHLDKSFLEECGVPGLVAGHAASHPDIPGITLKVPSDFVEKALKILEDHER